MNRTLIFLLAVLCIGAGAFWFWKRSPAKPVTAEAAAEGPSEGGAVPTVSVVPASRQDLSNTLTLTAEFVPYQEVDVMAKVAGYVQRINVDVGEVVRQGQVLAILESPEMRDDLTRAGASIQRNRADLRRAADEVKRAESSYAITSLTYRRLDNVMKTQPGLVAQQELDDAQAKDQVAASQLASAKSAYAAAEEQIKVAEADQSKFRTMLDYTRVVAPFDGVVTKRYADNGTMIQAGTSSRSQAMPVVRISQNQLLRLILPVPESAAAMVKVGGQVEVKAPSIGATLPAGVSRIADKVDTATRTMRVEVDIPNGNRRFIPGMYAEVTLRLSASNGTLAVPTQSLKTAADGKREVAIVDGNGVVEIRKVKTGLESATAVEVVEGLKEGELVVSGSHTQLSNGAKVKPTTQHAAAEGAK